MIVFEYKLCGIEYFLDKMQLYELDIMLNSLRLSYRHDWERTRFNSYIIAQCNSKKKLKPTDIIKFDWDDSIHKSTKKVSSEDVARLKEKMNKILQTQQNG